MKPKTTHLSHPIQYDKYGTIRLLTQKNLTVLCCPDTHFPAHHPDTFRFLKDMKDQFKPDIFLHGGDEVEFASLSFHDKNPEMPGALDEYLEAKECMKKLIALFPNALVCESNHTSRNFRTASKAGLPSQMLKSYNELFDAPPTWSWHPRIIINNVCYQHGDPLSGPNAAKNWMIQNRMSSVSFHVHAYAGVGYSASPFNQTFWMSGGCLIDLEHPFFKYSAKYANKGTLGCGIVKNGDTAFFIPMR
jgi:hypothetical protein